MASTVTGTTASGSLVFERRSARVHKYHWPAIQLNIWMIVMLIAASLIIGVFATFMQTQTQLQLASPWYFGYSITVASLCIVFILILLYLIYNRRLLPSIVLIGGFILFILWLVALIVISIQLWGANGVGSNCNLAVFSQDPRARRWRRWRGWSRRASVSSGRLFLLLRWWARCFCCGYALWLIRSLRMIVERGDVEGKWTRV